MLIPGDRPTDERTASSHEYRSSAAERGGLSAGRDTVAENAPAARGTDRFLLGIVAGAVLLAALGIVAVIVVGRTPAPRAADPASPVGVVQRYVEAIRNGDVDAAYGELSRSAQAGLSLDAARRRFQRQGTSASGEQRILIEPVTVDDDRAEVKVTVSRFSARADPFSSSTSHQDATVRLVREDGAWRINQPVGPYPFVN